MATEIDSEIHPLSRDVQEGKQISTTSTKKLERRKFLKIEDEVLVKDIQIVPKWTVAPPSSVQSTLPLYAHYVE